MPILELTLTATFQGQECVNRFNYIASGTPAAVSFSFGLFVAFGAQYDPVGPPAGYPATKPMVRIAKLQGSLVNYDGISIRNVYSNTDFWESPFIQVLTGGAGAATEAQSPVIAFGYRSSRVRSDIRRGQKRFVGVLEAHTGSGGSLLSTTISAAADVSAAMGEVLSYNDSGNILTFAPCIVGKQCYDTDTQAPCTPSTPANKKAYRYYPTEIEQNAFIAQGITWDVYNQVRSQTSRQYGRGR